MAQVHNYTPDQLAQIGGGKLAYVKHMTSEEVSALYPQAPELEPGLNLFALFGADGTPILLADSEEAAIASAWQQELVTVSLH
jgi:hypothetical protein